MSPKDWFQSWFNTPYYHMLYQHRDSKDAELFVQALVKKLAITEGDKVLDLACGRGRHARFLEQLGLKVCGIDLSEENIDYAKKHVPNVNFFVKDMREEFGLNKYDFIFNLFTSFGYFENDKEHIQSLKNIYTALKPKGVLTLDFLNVNRLKQGLIEDEEISTETGVRFNIRREIQNKKIVKTIAVYEENEEYSFQEKVTMLTLKDFERFFDQAGLTILDCFGDMKLSPFQESTSERLVIIAQRN